MGGRVRLRAISRFLRICGLSTGTVPLIYLCHYWSTNHLLPPCNQNVTIPPCYNANMFHFLILPENWSQLQLGYDEGTAQDKLLAADRSHCIDLHGDDLESYVWASHTLWLSPAAGQRLLQEAGCEPARLAMAYNQRAFLVCNDDRMLYGGIFLPIISAMGISFPVARLRIQSERVSIQLAPSQMPRASASPLEEPEIREQLRREGRLK